MARIPDDEIERLKRELDLGALVEARGVLLKPHGANDLIGRCPFHADNETPNFIVTPDKGLFHCMACGAAGNAFQFVQKLDGVSFRHAYELLSEHRPVRTSAPMPPPKLASPVAQDADDATLFAQVLDYYHERLLKTPAALEYLKGRGLYHEEALTTFRLGFADRTLGLRMPEAFRKEGAAIRTRLQKLGLYRESGHEHFSGSVVVPIFDAAGRCVEMYGRKITPGLRKGTPLHLYLPGPHAGIWNAAVLNEPELILCEAPLDALTFWVHGLRNVTFIYGTQGFTDEIFEALVSRKVRRVRIAYDADEAGNKAAARDAERLTAVGIEVLRVKFPWGMDANEYARKVQPAERSLFLSVNSAEPLAPSEHLALHGAYICKHAPASSSVLAANLAASAPPVAESCHADTTAANGKSMSAPEPVALDQRAPSTLLRAGDYSFLRFGPREYRVGGLEKNNSLEVMKVALRIRHGETFHLDSFDLLQDGQRRRFIERAAEETGLERDVIKGDMGKLLLALEREQEERLARAVEPHGRPVPDLTAEEKAEALAFLKSPDLFAKIGEAFDVCGLVGEEANRLAAYLACTSRKLAHPLAVIIQSTSAAGKSTLMEAVLAMFPEEERVKYSAMTGQSLYYLGEADLKHKILAIVEEEGAEKASYALKLLQSEGELTIASTGKDPQTGRMETQEYHVEGPVTILLTTTAIDIDEELQNRCLTLTVDESKAQTERIHTLQRTARTLDGLRLKQRKRTLLALLRNAQRLLAPVDVVNPFADRLTFTAERTRTRRDHEKYLTLIDVIALLHQYQRPRRKTPEGAEHIEVTVEDIALANRLAPELLGRSLDELPPQTRRVLDAMRGLVRERCRTEAIEPQHALISRRDLRGKLGWSVTQVRIHLERLRELDYVAARYGRPGAAFQYELLTDAGEADGVESIGLLDVERLRSRAAVPHVRQEPDGVLDNLTGGWRGGVRQGEGVEEEALAVNLTA